MTIRRALTALALTLAAALAACTPDHPTAIAQPVALAALTVAPEDSAAHYARTDWGQWAQHGQCDTRENVLTAQGRGVVVDGACRPGCPAALPPCWTSPYDDVTTADPAALQVDHLVPLAEAAHSGAAAWTPAQRHGYYNDPRNLVAVTAHANTSKGDRDPGEWKPSARDSWCAYATGWASVKAKYGLTADQAEMDALTVMLATCPAGTP